MLNFSKQVMPSDDIIFQKNEEQVNRNVCRGMAYAFWVFPVLLILNAIGMFFFTEKIIIMLTVVGTFCTLSPLLISKFVQNQTFIKWYAMLCIIVVVSALGSQYHVGIYITFILASIVSCSYFDRKFTMKVLFLSWIGYLIAHYFRSLQTRDILYPTQTVLETYLPSVTGYTIEFILSFIFLNRLADWTVSILSKQKDLISKLTKNETKVQLAMEATTDILYEYNIKEDYYTSNGSIQGFVRKDVEIKKFVEYVHNDIEWKTRDFLNAMEKFTKMPEEEGNRFHLELCMSYMLDGKEYPQWALIDLNIIRDANGMPEVVFGKIRDITKQKLEEIKTDEARNYDTLTGMYHYRSLRKIIKESEALARGKTHQIMIINIKNYQEIAQTYGEVYRDFVVMNAAEVIKQNVQGQGILTCRLSDEVFLVYVEDCDVVDSRKIRQDLNAGLRSIYVGENKTNKLVYDFGYYLGEEQIDELLQVALRYVSTSEDIKELEEEENPTLFPSEQTFNELYNAKQENDGEIFIKNIDNLISSTKDYRSAVQMSFAWAGKFFDLDGIRVYEISDSKERTVPEFAWAATQEIEKECGLMVLSHQVASFFVDNFGRSRVVDNTIGAFQDFFRQFGENPLLLSNYSSLICPLISEDKCRAIMLYDVHQTDYVWSDEQKECLLELSKIMGNVVLAILADSSIREKHVFLANMSHEVRMPISTIAGVTEIARNEIDNPEAMNRCLNTIDKSTKDLVSILDDILDLSKMEIGKLNLAKEIFSVEDVLAQIENKVKDVIGSKDIIFSLERKFQENLLCGDAKRITQVLVYLIKNAVKHTNLGGRVEVLVEEIESGKDSTEIFFSVKDSGSGMTKEAMEKVFVEFEKNDSLHSEKHGDTGLILSVCYNVVQLMGGELQVKSESGKGTEFFFTLKLDVPLKENMLEYFADKSGLEKETINLADKTVLVAEDNEVNADIMKHLLEMKGAKVLVAHNGIKCVDLYNHSKEGEIAFILMDVNMPVLNGHEATREIRSSVRKDAKRIPIIAMSANTYEEDVKESIGAGMDAHLMKPIKLNTLLKEVSKILFEKSRAKKED